MSELNKKSFHERMSVGKYKEGKIADFLAKKYLWNLSNPTEDEDKWDKIDRIRLHANGDRSKIQIKEREGREDLLISVYQPFYSLNDPNNKWGRDMVGEADTYVCWCNDKLVVIAEAKKRELVKSILGEWDQSGGFWHDKYNGNKTWNSKNYWGVQLKYTEDASSGVPKLLCFIPVGICTEIGATVMNCTKEALEL